jgi:hypothetical protein
VAELGTTCTAQQGEAGQASGWVRSTNLWETVMASESTSEASIPRQPREEVNHLLLTQSPAGRSNAWQGSLLEALEVTGNTSSCRLFSGTTGCCSTAVHLLGKHGLLSDFPGGPEVRGLPHRCNRALCSEPIVIPAITWRLLATCMCVRWPQA